MIRRSLLTACLLAAPRAALACPVCFGQNDSPLAKGVNMGIFMMLGIVGVVLAAFATFFVYLMRRARLVERMASGDTGRPVAGGYGSTPQEGTAQC
jgi:hypothetical protein